MEEYQTTLFSKRKWNERRDNIALDDIAMIVHTFLPRRYKPMGHEIKLYPDSVGVVDVNSSTGILTLFVLGGGQICPPSWFF